MESAIVEVAFFYEITKALEILRSVKLPGLFQLLNLKFIGIHL